MGYRDWRVEDRGWRLVIVNGYVTGLSVIKRGADGTGAALQDVGVDHGGLDILVSEEFLYCADIISILQKMGGIGWKGGALLLCRSTFPPSPLQTGQATRRCIRLSHIVLSQWVAKWW
jgi:hypothetical protein